MYTCHYWKKSPYVIFGTLSLLLLLSYFVAPICIAILYIKNQQGKSTTCFIYSSDTGDNQNFVYQDHEAKQSWIQLVIKIVLSFTAVGILAGIIYMFITTENDLNLSKSEDAILKIQLFRNNSLFSISILS